MYPDNNPKTRVGGALKLPFHLIPPRALGHVALAFADGAFKYQPYNWRNEPISASVYHGASLRHQFNWWEGSDFAPDCVAHELAHSIACLMMILDTMGTPYFNDNRPPRMVDPSFGELLAQLATRLPELRERENTQFDLHDIPRSTDHGG